MCVPTECSLHQLNGMNLVEQEEWYNSKINSIFGSVVTEDVLLGVYLKRHRVAKGSIQLPFNHRTEAK